MPCPTNQPTNHCCRRGGSRCTTWPQMASARCVARQGACVHTWLRGAERWCTNLDSCQSVAPRGTAGLVRGQLTPCSSHSCSQLMSKWLAKHELNRKSMSDLSRNARQLAAWHQHTQRHGRRDRPTQPGCDCPRGPFCMPLRISIKPMTISGSLNLNGRASSARATIALAMQPYG